VRCIVGRVYKHKHVIPGGVFPEASWQQYCSHTEFKFSISHSTSWLCNVGCLGFLVVRKSLYQ